MRILGEMSEDVTHRTNMDLKTVYFAVGTLNDSGSCPVDGLGIVMKNLGVLPLQFEPSDIQ